MRKSTLLPLTALSLFTLSACGSPLFDHRKADPLPISPQRAETPVTPPATPTPMVVAPESPNPTPTTRQCSLEFPGRSLCAKLVWDNLAPGQTIGSPDEEGYRSFRLLVWDKEIGTESGPYADPGLNLKAVLWMPDMGHGSSPTRVAQGAPGQFSVSQVYFSMGGFWEIRLQLRQGASVVSQAVVGLDL